MNYCGFDVCITIQPAPFNAAGYLVTIHHLVEPPATAHQYVEGFDSVAFENTLLRPLRAFIAAPPADAALRELGRQLAALLLPPHVRALLFAILARNASSAAPIRLLLQVDVPELIDLPWELAYLDAPRVLQGIAGHLGQNPRLHLVRCPTPMLATAAVPADPLRVLVAWSDPCSPTSPRLPFASEEARSVLAVLQWPSGFRIHARELPHATPARLRESIREWQPHILHFIGHGEDRHGFQQQGGALVLEGTQSGSQEFVTGKDLVEWLAGIDVRLVSLSACATASVAHSLIAGGIGAVLAMQLPWREVTATPFFRSFYSALLEPKTVHDALREGRQTLRHAVPDWAVPALYLSRDTGTLFAVTDRRERHSKPVFSNLPYAQNPDFRGRDKDLTELHRSLTTSSQPLALVGLGGLGKTQLASEYAHRFRHEYPGGIFWINARDTLRMKEDYADINRALDSRDAGSPEERAQRMRLMLQELTEPSLVIYDNITRDTDLRLLPTVGHCRILATVREDYTVRGRFRLQPISALDDEAAWTLLQTRISASDPAEQQAVKEIAVTLGNLPLALVLVAEHVRSSVVDQQGNAIRQPFSSYLKRLTLGPQKLLDRARRRFTAFTNHDGALFDAIEISYRSLTPTAQTMLAIASCFAARGIPPALLLSACDIADPDEFSEALMDLTAFSLVTREEDGRLSLHAVVRFFARGQVNEDALRDTLGRVAGVLVARLNAANESMDLRTIRPDIAHCRAVADLCRSHPTPRHYLDLLRELGIFYFAQGELDKACEHLMMGLAMAQQRHGPQNLEVALCLRHLANVKQAQAEHARGCGEHEVAAVRYAEARRESEQALEIVQTLYGPEHSQTIDYYNDLGYIFRCNADMESAKHYYTRALEITLKCYGSRHENVAMCLNNIAIVLESQQRYDDALGKLRRSRSILRRLYGVRQSRFGYRVFHVRYAIRMNNIGRILRKQGKARAALARHNVALSVFLELSADDPRGNRDLGYTYNFIADARRLLDQPAEARYYYELALPMLSYCLGDTHAICREVQAKLRSLSDEGTSNP
jgi:tetratricopeptide (TPR) repeat protein